jgi:hypothetical protein
MKIANIFKKKTSRKLEIKAEVLNSSQLEKVIGGVDSTDASSTSESTAKGGRVGAVKWGNINS